MARLARGANWAARAEPLDTVAAVAPEALAGSEPPKAAREPSIPARPSMPNPAQVWRSIWRRLVAEDINGLSGGITLIVHAWPGRCSSGETLCQHQCLGYNVAERGKTMPLRDHFHPPVTKRAPWDALHG